MRPTIILFLAFAVTLFCSACGGGGDLQPNAPPDTETPDDPGDPGDVQTLEIDYITLAETNSPGGLAIGGPEREVGDRADGVGVRAVLEFPLGDIPAGATITEASLSITFLRILGTPFAKLGNFQVVRIEYTPLSLGAEYDRPVLAYDPDSDLDFLSTPSRPAIDVTAVVTSSFDAGDERVRMRLQFPVSSSGDGIGDYVVFATKIGSFPPPVLEVKYTTP